MYTREKDTENFNAFELLHRQVWKIKSFGIVVSV